MAPHKGEGPARSSAHTWIFARSSLERESLDRARHGERAPPQETQGERGRPGLAGPALQGPRLLSRLDGREVQGGHLRRPRRSVALILGRARRPGALFAHLAVGGLLQLALQGGDLVPQRLDTLTEGVGQEVCGEVLAARSSGDVGGVGSCPHGDGEGRRCSLLTLLSRARGSVEALAPPRKEKTGRLETPSRPPGRTEAMAGEMERNDRRHMSSESPGKPCGNGEGMKRRVLRPGPISPGAVDAWRRTLLLEASNLDVGDRQFRSSDATAARRYYPGRRRVPQRALSLRLPWAPASRSACVLAASCKRRSQQT